MKRKLNIPVDADHIPASEEGALPSGMSSPPSKKNSPREANADGSKSFASRWRGKFKPAERETSRYDTLKQKYLE